MSTPNVIFTLAAAKKVWELMVEEENLNLKLRAFVTGGGCSGLQYGFTFEEEVNDDDTVVTVALDNASGQKLVRLLIDPMSFQYLMGAEIDYKEDVEGAQFVIRNPNAKTSCGCGSSFSV
jgi:iron-sulfur cluster insertion protein